MIRRPITSCQVYVHEDAAVAEEVARREIGAYYASVMAHYEMTGEHFESTDGYEYYARLAEQLQNLEQSDIVDRYLRTQVYGDPDQCVAKIAKIMFVAASTIMRRLLLMRYLLDRVRTPSQCALVRSL